MFDNRSFIFTDTVVPYRKLRRQVFVKKQFRIGKKIQQWKSYFPVYHVDVDVDRLSHSVCGSSVMSTDSTGKNTCDTLFWHVASRKYAIACALIKSSQKYFIQVNTQSCPIVSWYIQYHVVLNHGVMTHDCIRLYRWLNTRVSCQKGPICHA